VFAGYQCNAIGLSINGDISDTLGGNDVIGKGRVSQSCAGERMDNGNWHKIRFTYNAYDHRARIYQQGDGGENEADGYWDFDLNLRAVVGADIAYIGFSANTGYWTCATMQFANLEHFGPRSDGWKTALEGAVTLPRVDEWGSIRIRARDPNGRNRGRGGNTWNAQILDSTTHAVAQWEANSPQWYDRADGTYYFYFRIRQRGRYDIFISCNPGSAPNICDHPMTGAANSNPSWVKITTIFIRTVD
jgi:hypothetical protein